MSSPRRRTWSWAHLPEEDYRSQITLPSSELFDLGTAYLTRYRDGGGADDIDQAITYLELAVATAPDSTVPKHLSQLGTAYRQRFGCHGLPADLDYAIDCREQALALAPQDDPERVIILSSLGLAYSVRYQLGGAGSDLDRAVSLTERALEASPASEDDRTSAMANAAIIYRLRYQRSRAPDDLDRSIELHKQTVGATREDHPRLAGRLANFSAALLDRYRRDEVPDDLDQAIDLEERALTATPEEHHSRPLRLQNLGVSRLERYGASGLTTDLYGGIEALLQAETAIPDGSPILAKLVSSLSNACLTSGAARQGIGQRMLPVLVRRLASADGSPPSDRVYAGTTLGALANALGEHATARKVLNAAIGLLPAVAGRHGGLRLDDGLLTIPEISRCHLSSAELAYLSACSTAHRSWDHVDESVNLASVFHLAGFRHVIASLWPLHDGVAAAASRSFYRSLPQGPGATNAAQALHQVTWKLRAQHPNRPDLWASLIHSGP